MNNPNPQKDSRDPPRSPPPETLISTSRCTRDRVFSGKSGNPGKTSGFLPQFSPGQTWNRRNDGMGSTPIVQKILAIAITGPPHRYLPDYSEKEVAENTPFQ
jgi:hypothetical protein